MNSVHITDLEAWCSIEFGGYEANPLSDAHHLFLNGEEIQDLELPNDMTSIGNYVFAGFSGLSSITIPNNVRSIGIGTFIGCTGITTIAIPNSVTEIGEYAFENCSNLTSITLPKEIKRIKSSTFNSCSQLASIAIPNGVTRIDDYAFQHCSGLKTITIPNSVTRIGYSAFEFCNFNTIILGSGVKKIGGRAYAESPGLTDVYCYTEMVPEIDYDAFERTDYNKVTLHVPAGAIDQYKNTIIYPWSQFVNIVALSDDDPLPTSVILSSITRINEPNYYYTFEGIKVSNPKRGVYIIRMKNGKVKKVFVK